MEKEIKYGTPNFVLRYNRKLYSCKYILKYERVFLKIKDLNTPLGRIMGFMDKLLTDISLIELEDIRYCLLHNGYQMYGEFSAEFLQKERILNDTLQNGKYYYGNCVITKEFIYLGSEKQLQDVVGGHGRFIPCDYYKHVPCGGCIQQHHLIKDAKEISIYLCTKCGNIFTSNDINKVVNLLLRAPVTVKNTSLSDADILNPPNDITITSQSIQ